MTIYISFVETFDNYIKRIINLHLTAVPGFTAFLFSLVFVEIVCLFVCSILTKPDVRSSYVLHFRVMKLILIGKSLLSTELCFY